MIQETKTELTPPVVYSYYQSVRHFCILSFFSLGMYPFFWFFKHCQYLRDEKKLDISPSFRTAFTLFYGYTLFNEFYLLAIEKGYKKNLPLFLIFICFMLFSVLVSIKGSLLSFCILFSFIFLIPVHRMMNFYYLKAHEHAIIRDKLSKGEKRFLRSIWIGLFVIAFLGIILP